MKYPRFPSADSGLNEKFLAERLYSPKKLNNEHYARVAAENFLRATTPAGKNSQPVYDVVRTGHRKVFLMRYFFGADKKFVAEKVHYFGIFDRAALELGVPKKNTTARDLAQERIRQSAAGYEKPGYRTTMYERQVFLTDFNHDLLLTVGRGSTEAGLRKILKEYLDAHRHEFV